MQLSTFVLPLFVSLVAASTAVTISIQAVGTGSTKTPISSLASISYGSQELSASITSYDAPDLSSGSELLRIGVYDSAKKVWTSSTSVTSAESFSKGYSPIITVSLDAQGTVMGVSCRSGKIDAGQTRDFGPKVKVVRMAKTPNPELNKPIELSPEGKVEVPVPEKTFVQKYWMIGVGLVLMLALGGGGEK